MQGGDGGLHPVRPGRPAGQRPDDQGPPLLDHRPVPAPPVLVLQEHRLALRPGPRVAPGVDEQQQREEPGALPLGGQQAAQYPGQPDRLLGQVEPLETGSRAGRVPLGEDRVDDLEDAGQPRGQFVGAGHPERDPGLADLLLGPHDALGHGRRRHEERPRHLRGGEPGEAAQGQSGAVLGGEGGVGAGEEQLEPLVRKLIEAETGTAAGAGTGPETGAGHVRTGGGLGAFRVGGEDGEPGGVRLVAPQPVHRLPPGGRQQPGPGPGGDTFGGPVPQRGLDRLGRHLLGQVEVPEPADEGGEQQPALLPEHRLDGFGGHKALPGDTPPPARSGSPTSPPSPARSGSSASPPSPGTALRLRSPRPAGRRPSRRRANRDSARPSRGRRRGRARRSRGTRPAAPASRRTARP